MMNVTAGYSSVSIVLNDTSEIYWLSGLAIDGVGKIKDTYHGIKSWRKS